MIGASFCIFLNIIIQLVYYFHFLWSRIAALEMLDEIEELELVLDHYVISWGFKVASDPEGGNETHATYLGWGLKYQETTVET